MDLGQSGVYVIGNLTNGKEYVGSAVSLRKRWAQHRSELRSGKHHSVHLQRAWDKHGEEAFEFKVLLLCAREHLVGYEQRCLDGFRPAYNISPIAGSCLGIRRSEAFKEKARRASSGRQHSAESRAKMSQIATGRQHSPETKAALSAARIGVIPSPETVAKRAASNTGKVRSPEACARISQGQQGRVFSAEHKAKLSAAAILRCVRAGEGKGTTEASEKMRAVANRRWETPAEKKGTASG